MSVASSDDGPELPDLGPQPVVAPPTAPATRPASSGMSWAERARLAKDAAVKISPAVIATTTVVGFDNAASEVTASLRNATHKNTRHNLPKSDKAIVALDANAFIKGLDDLLSMADVFVTVPQVIQEVKDRNARELLERLPFKLEVLDPRPESIARVVQKAERTGDFGALSRTDVRLCALALECAEQIGVLRHDIEPRGARINPGQSGSVEVVTEEQSDDEEDEENDLPDEDDWGDDDNDDKAASAQPRRSTQRDDDDDGEGEWITPASIKAAREKVAGPAFSGSFACVTSDFPMQNTLIHLGVPIIGPQGRVIRELRTWLLRCHACFELVHDTAKQFCPACGSGDTLKRVSYTVDDLGEKKLFINFKRQISTRGTIFNLPKPRGGRKGTNRTLALREDQLAKCGKVAAQLKHQQIAREDDLAQFGVTEHKATTRFDPNMPRVFSSYKTYNPNERKKAAAARRR